MWMYIQQSEVAVQTHEKWLKKTLVMKENQEDWGSIMKFAASFGEKNSVTVLCR